MLGTRAVFVAAMSTWLAFACVTGAGCDRSGRGDGTTPPTASSEETAPRSSRPSRSEIACHLHSCAPPKYCNRDKGVCEPFPCADSRNCPYGYRCDFGENVCR